MEGWERFREYPGSSEAQAEAEFLILNEVPAKVVSIEYDPNRTARIALLHYLDGEKRYILAPDRLEVGHQVMAGENAEITVGNALPIRKIPVGTQLHNIELKHHEALSDARACAKLFLDSK